MWFVVVLLLWIVVGIVWLLVDVLVVFCVGEGKIEGFCWGVMVVV